MWYTRAAGNVYLMLPSPVRPAEKPLNSGRMICNARQPRPFPSRAGPPENTPSSGRRTGRPAHRWLWPGPGPGATGLPAPPPILRHGWNRRTQAEAFVLVTGGAAGARRGPLWSKEPRATMHPGALSAIRWNRGPRRWLLGVGERAPGSTSCAAVRHWLAEHAGREGATHILILPSSPHDANMHGSVGFHEMALHRGLWPSSLNI